MSSRKVGKSKWKEGQRKSPRISALDAGKKTQTQTQQSRRVGRSVLAPQPQAMDLQEKKPQTPASRTRASDSGSGSARKIRKLRPLDDVAAQQPNDVQGSNQHSPEDCPITSDQPTSQGASGPTYDDKAASPDRPLYELFTKWMPEKRILELILDILQRRDTYEIFAEPVDPEEVEEYYEIIKEPMDFGTMRAKLHEGMYTSLQQFEHDIYLISRNAMHFNSSSTIYFRQARAIHELAKKVFHALKTDPDNFELENLETRRRTSRRLMSHARAPSYISNSKLAKNLRLNSKTNISSKTMPRFLHNSSNLRKSIRGICGHSGAATDLNARDHEVHSGAINGQRNMFAEVDRHCTYRPWSSLLSENDSIVSTVYSGSKPLIPVNQQDIGYTDSLMFFVKDLGPTAQMIAKQKLIRCSVDASTCWSPGSKHLFRQPECQNHNAFDYTQSRLPIQDTAESEMLIDHPTISEDASYKVDTFYAGAGGNVSAWDRMLIHKTSLEVASSSNQRKKPVTHRGDAHSSNAVDVFGLFACDRLHQGQYSESESQLDSNPSSVGARELNLSVAGLKNLGKSSTPGIMIKSNCYSQARQLESSSAQSLENMSLDSRWSNNYQTVGSTSCSEMKGSRHHKESPVLRSGGQDEVSGSVETGQEWKARQPTRVGSQFIFDLPYLRKRLDQINSFQRGSGNEDSFLDKVNWKRQSAACSNHKELSTETYNDSYKQLSLDAQHGELALQLCKF